MEFFAQFNHWSWWVIGIVLIIIEVFAPAAFFLWMGISAIITGVFVWIFPSMDWTIQVLIFSIQSVLSIVVWRKFFKHAFAQTDQPTLNKRAQQYFGRTFTLIEPIINGVGKIIVDDSTWRVVADEDLPEGTKVSVTGEEGMSLKVEKI